MSVDLFPILVAGVFGLLLGSFLNVCIARLPRDESVVTPRSRCPHCGALITWRDNIPVLSWLLLAGRCRHCRAPIAVRYPLVELATGGIWAWMVWLHAPSLEAVRGAVLATLLLGIAVTDAREYIIPDEFSLGGLGLALLFSVAGGIAGVGEAVLGAAVGFGLLWAVGAAGTWAFKEEAMGGGDVKMMAMVGAFLGWQGVLLTVFLGAVAGSAVFVPLHLAGRKKLVPFGVFLAIGAGITYLVGPALVAWYREFVGL